MRKWVKIAAATIAAAAVVILAYALLTPQSTNTDTDHMGMMGGNAIYSSANVALIALSIVMIVAAVMVLALWQEYEPLAPAAQPQTLPVRVTEPLAPQTKEPENVTPAPAPPHDPEEVAAREYLILRLLTGDERTMFKAVVDSGGEALQKDLIVRTKMSNAKVSRLLDKLEQKSVITKDRHGATNKIRIKPE